MRFATFFAFVVSGCVIGQVQAPEGDGVKKLSSSLAALKDAQSAQTSHRARIAEDIMSVSEEQHRPPRYAVEMFSYSLVRAISGKQMSDLQASQLATAIVEVMRSAGVATYRFRQSISRFRATLMSLQVSATIARNVSEQLMAVGKQVRGPEDLPALPLLR